MCLPGLLIFLAVKSLLGGQLECYTKRTGRVTAATPKAVVSAQTMVSAPSTTGSTISVPLIHKHPVRSP